ncbi:uncharacterized protein C17orf113-like [Argopecten irradians]|uniref:uncharacterized protein C17orf113-like n=1 Tax=Argopecten irradians TaxID=31199 RepID=UPI0037118B98
MNKSENYTLEVKITHFNRGYYTWTIFRVNRSVTGSKNYQRSALVRHMKSDDHTLAKKIVTQQRYFEAATSCVKGKFMPVLEAQIRTATHMAERNIPNRQYLGLIDLQISNQSSVLTEANRSCILSNHQAAQKMQEYSANVLRELTITRIIQSPFIAIMVDESLDIATNKKLVMFCKIVHGGKVKIEFVANIPIQDGKAETVYNCIVNWLQEIGYDISKVSGFGSVSVMFGKISGVGVRLQRKNPRIVHIWCSAHRLSLVSYWAAKDIPFLKSVNEMLIAILNFYHFSAPRYNKLKELTSLMGKKVKRFKKPTQVRWLSMSDAVSTCFDCYSVLILGLEHEVASSPHSEGGNKARGILKKIKNIKFLMTLALLKDILGHLDLVSKVFQKDNLDINQLKTIVASTSLVISSYLNENTPTVQEVVDQTDEHSEWQGIPICCSLRDRIAHRNFRKKYVNNLLGEFSKRFPDSSLGVLHDLNIVLNPSKLPESVSGIKEHGLGSLENIIDFYNTCSDENETQPLVDSGRMKKTFLQFKHVVNMNREMDVTEFCLLVIKDYNELFPDFATIASILLTCPLTSVPCERGFSLQNRHVNAVTSRRSVSSVEDRMVIEYCSKQKGYNQNEVVQKAAEKYYAQNR